MADTQVVRHLALIVIILLGLFIYGGFRLRNASAHKQPSGAAPQPDPLATAAPQPHNTAPVPDQVPAPSTPLPAQPEAYPADLPDAPLETAAAPRATLGGKTSETALEPKPADPNTQETPPATPPALPTLTERAQELLHEINRDNGNNAAPTTEPAKRPAAAAPNITIESDGRGNRLAPSAGVARNAPPADGSVYTVRAKDTLWSIAARQVPGDRVAAYIQALRRANASHLHDDRLFPGMRLALPAISHPSPASAPLPPSRTYTVQRGDTLSDIAQRFLGSATAWPRIQAANRHLISNPNQLQVGMQLRIPAKN